MGCTNEKECKERARVHTCGMLDIKYTCYSENKTKNLDNVEKTQFKIDIKDHYLMDSISSDFEDSSSFFFDKKTEDVQKERRSSSFKIENFNQTYSIGQHFKMGDENDGMDERRSKSFNPDQEWKKKDEEYQMEYLGEYDDRKEKLKTDFCDEYLKNYYYNNKEKYNKKLKLGPSQEFRWQSWKIKLLNDKEFNKEILNIKVSNLYESLLCPFLLNKEDKFIHSNMQLIAKDITRTFPEMEYFEKIVGQQQLKRTLQATSNLMKNAGYCQGMNFIMGMLLIIGGGDEASAFDCFISLSFRQEFMLVGLFENGFPLLRFLEFAFNDLFKTHLPDLFEHFKLNDIQNTAWITKWLITLYLYSFPLSKCIRIMDYLISSNIFSLIYVAIQVIKKFEYNLIQMDGVEIITFFSRRSSVCERTEQQKQISLDQINIEEVIQTAEKVALTDKQIRKLARECKQALVEEYTQMIDEGSCKNDNDSDMFMQKYAIEISNITFFIHYYTLYGKKNQQLEYLQTIKNKFINQDFTFQSKQEK